MTTQVNAAAPRNSRRHGRA